MIGAVVTTLMGGVEMAKMAAIPAVVGLLCAFVAYGRWKLAPIRPKRRAWRMAPASVAPRPPGAAAWGACWVGPWLPVAAGGVRPVAPSGEPGAWRRTRLRAAHRRCTRLGPAQ